MAAGCSSSCSRGNMKPQPMMLKDFLREDLCSESFRMSQPRQKTVRYLLDVEFKKRRESDTRETSLKGRSRSPLSRISAVLCAVRILPFVSSATSCSSPSSSSSSTNVVESKQGVLPRSFSRKFLRRSFWSKRARERTKQCSPQNAAATNGTMFLRDIIRQSSFADETRGGKPIVLPADLSPSASPVAVSSGRNSSSCSSSGWSDGGSLSTGSDSVPSPSSPDTSSDFAKPELRSPEKSKMAKMAATTGLVCGTNSGVEVTDRPTMGVGGDSGPTATDAARYLEARGKEDGSERLECACNQHEHNEFGPASIMNFPYELEVEPKSGAATPPSSFHQTLAKLGGGKHHVPHKIRRFKTVAHLVDPLHLDDCLTTKIDPAPAGQWDHDDDDLNSRGGEEAEQVGLASALVEQVGRRSCSKRRGDEDEFEDLLLLHFFIEGLRDESARREPTWRVTVERRKDRALVEELLCVARDWVDGTETFAEDGTGTRGGIEWQIEEMQRDGRWRCFHADEDEIALELESRVFGSLVEELSQELLTGP